VEPQAKRARLEATKLESSAPQDQLCAPVRAWPAETEAQKHVAVYVCLLSSKRGKFLPAKAKALGVKPYEFRRFCVLSLRFLTSPALLGWSHFREYPKGALHHFAFCQEDM
jgi:hypothetical protein